MQIKFSSKLFKILGYAKDEAMRTGHYATGVDHLTLAMLRHRDNEGCLALRELGGDISELKSSIDSCIFRSGAVPYDHFDHIQPSKASQKLVSMAAYEALRSKSPLVEPQHLLLALARFEDSITFQWLKTRGLNYEAIKNFFERKEKLHPQEKFPKAELMAMLGERLSQLYSQSEADKDFS